MKKITFKNISKYYKNNNKIKSILYKINFELNVGEMVLIKGQSGSGKTTLLNIISGLVIPNEGNIYIDNTKVIDLFKYRKECISHIYQDLSLIEKLSVYENIKIYLDILGIKDKKIDKTLKELNILHLKHTKVYKLSGGEKQRVSIARALLKPSLILVADEPTAFLDKNNTKRVYNLLKKETKKRIVVITSHKPNHLKPYVNKIITIKNESIKTETIKPIIQKSNLNYKYKFKLKEKIIISIKRIKSYKNYSLFICLIYLFLIVTSTYMINLYKKDINYFQSYYNIYLSDYSLDRIIINKKNKTSFNKSDYKKIYGLDKNITIKDDLLLDEKITIKTNNKKLILKIDNNKTKKNYLYLDDKQYKKYKHLHNKRVYLQYENYTKKIKIDSIKKGKDNYILLSNLVLKELKPYVIIKYSDIYLNNRLMTTYKVKFNNFPKEETNVIIKTPYYEKDITKALISSNVITLDKDSLNTNNSYQKSIYVKNSNNINKIKNKLINNGYNVFVIKDSLHSDIKDIISIISLLKNVFVLSIIFIIYLFGYFILKIILSSNKNFYMVLKRLDVSDKEMEEVIFIEFFILENIVTLFILLRFNLSKISVFISYIMIMLIIKKISKKGVHSDRN